jgi:arsenate reductase
MATGKLTVYHYPACGTCRSAIQWLRNRGYELELHNLWEEAPPAERLAEWIPASGVPLRKWFNVSGDAYRELGLKDRLPGMADEEAIRLLAGNGKLIKRPVVTDGRKVTVGFKEELYRENW